MHPFPLTSEERHKRNRAFGFILLSLLVFACVYAAINPSVLAPPPASGKPRNTSEASSESVPFALWLSSDSKKAGYKLGVDHGERFGLSENKAPTELQLEALAKSASPKTQGADDWIAGYKIGFEKGFKTATKPAF